MKKINIVKDSKDFDFIMKNKKIVKCKSFIIYFNDNNLPYYRFGISVGKKIGNAVTRNYYKRIIRQICDNNKKYYNNGMDYIIILRKEIEDLSYNDFERDFIYLMKKIGKEKQDEKF